MSNPELKKAQGWALGSISSPSSTEFQVLGVREGVLQISAPVKLSLRGSPTGKHPELEKDDSVQCSMFWTFQGNVKRVKITNGKTVFIMQLYWMKKITVSCFFFPKEKVLLLINYYLQVIYNYLQMNPIPIPFLAWSQSFPLSEIKYIETHWNLTVLKRVCESSNF